MKLMRYRTQDAIQKSGVKKIAANERLGMRNDLLKGGIVVLKAQQQVNIPLETTLHRFAVASHFI